MSSSRANASAVQRRTNNPSPSKQPVNNTRYQQQHPVQNPKLSVSDAIALTTIRLAKVETFINNLPPLDQLEAYSNQQQPNCMITENVFNSIVSRLDKLEKLEFQSLRGEVQVLREDIRVLKEGRDIQSLREEFQTLREGRDIQSLREEFQTLREGSKDLLEFQLLREEIQSLREESKDLLEVQTLREGSKNLLEGQTLREEFQTLREENRELKNLILFLQNYTLQTNQKLTDIIFNQDSIQVEEQELSQHIHELLNSEKDETICVPITDIPEENNDNLNINI
jgi:hypothetical protein